MLHGARGYSGRRVRSASVAMAVLACIAVSVLAVSAGAQPVPEPKVTVLDGLGHRVTAKPTASQFVTRLPNGDTVVDHADAPIKVALSGHFKVQLGERVDIHTASAALSVRGALGLGEVRSPARSRTVNAIRLDLRGHRWALVIPRNSGRVDRLRIEVSYHSGGAGYEAGIRLVSRGA